MAFAHNIATLGMAEDHIMTAGIAQHHRRYRACKRAFRLVIHILCAQLHALIIQRLGQRMQQGERRHQGHFNMFRSRIFVQFANEIHGFRQNSVHFPVAGNQAAHRISHPSPSLISTFLHAKWARSVKKCRYKAREKRPDKIIIAFDRQATRIAASCKRLSP